MFSSICGFCFISKLKLSKIFMIYLDRESLVHVGNRILILNGDFQMEINTIGRWSIENKPGFRVSSTFLNHFEMYPTNGIKYLLRVKLIDVLTETHIHRLPKMEKWLYLLISYSNQMTVAVSVGRIVTDNWKFPLLYCGRFSLHTAIFVNGLNALVFSIFHCVLIAG